MGHVCLFKNVDDILSKWSSGLEKKMTFQLQGVDKSPSANFNFDWTVPLGFVMVTYGYTCKIEQEVFSAISC